MDNKNKYGIWEIYGEDPNCDLGGSHINPFLGTAEGSHDTILAYAKTLPRWDSWGGGGYIQLRTENKVILNEETNNIISHIDSEILKTSLKLKQLQKEREKKLKQHNKISKEMNKDFYMITLKQGFGTKIIHKTLPIAKAEAKRLSDKEEKPAYILSVKSVYYNGKYYDK